MDSYNPLVAPAPEAWLALDEDARIRRVTEWHQAAGVELADVYPHAMMHAVVETQVAEGDKIPVAQRLRQLMAQGLDRHQAIHAIASVLAHHLVALSRAGADISAPDERYYSALKRLNAKKWLRFG